MPDVGPGYTLGQVESVFEETQAVFAKYLPWVLMATTAVVLGVFAFGLVKKLR